MLSVVSDYFNKLLNYFKGLQGKEVILWAFIIGLIILLLVFGIIQTCRISNLKKQEKLIQEVEALFNKKQEEEAALKLAEEEEAKAAEEALIAQKEVNNLTYQAICAAELGKVTHAICDANPNELVSAVKSTCKTFKDDQITFIFKVDQNLTQDLLNDVNSVILETEFEKSNIMLALNGNDYISNFDTYKDVITLIKDNELPIAVLDMGNIIDHNALVDFDFVTLNKQFKNKYNEDDSNFKHILVSGNAYKAVEIESIEEVSEIVNKEYFSIDGEGVEIPYFYSNNLFVSLSDLALLTFVRIQSLPDLLPDYLFDAAEPVVEEKVFEDVAVIKEETEETPVVAEVKEETPAEEPAVEEEAEEVEEDEEKSLSSIKTKPFAVKMVNTSDENKEYYNAIKNALLKHDKVRAQYSKSGDGFMYKNKSCAKVRLVGKTLRLYLDLNPLGYPTTRFHQKDMSDVKKYVRTPFMVKVKSNVGLKKALFLIDEMARIYAMDLIENYNDVNHMEHIEEEANLYLATHPEF